MPTLLFASELAALLGRHRYRSSAEALVALWSRLDHGSLEAAQRRRETRAVTSDDVERRVAHNVDSPPPGVDVNAFVRKQLKKPAKAASDPESLKKAVRDMRDVPPERREAAIRALCGHESLELKPEVTARVNILIQKAAALRDPAVLALECERIRAIPKLGDSERMKSAVVSRVYKHRGIANERDVLRAYAHDREDAVRTDSTFYKKVVGSSAPEEGGPSIMIGGRVDALRGDDVVVEIKCRQNRLFHSLPDYEFVQIMVYMHLTGRARCDVVQHHEGVLRVTEQAFDEDAWKGIEEGILRVADRIGRVLTCHTAQDELLRTCSCA